MNWLATGGTVAALAVLAGPAFGQAHVAGAERFVRSMADRAISSLTQPGISESDRQARFKVLFDEAFALRGIATYVLGRNWRTATPAQQEEFLRLFEEITIGSWANKFVEYSNRQLIVLGAVPVPSALPGESAALVKTELKADGGTGFKVDWRVANKDTLYKITDIMVEGISLANTYRDEYAAAFARSGNFEGLLIQLRAKRSGAVAEAQRPPAGN